MDVTRLRYVSPLFATALAACGYDSVKKVADADVNKLYDAVITTNDEQKIYKGKIGMKSDVVMILDWHVEQESVIGYIIRDDIV